MYSCQIFMFFSKILLCVFYHFYCYMFISCVYICGHEYMLCFAFSCSYVIFLFVFKGLGVKMHTFQRVQMFGIYTDKDDVEQRTYGKGMCIQE